MTTKTKSRLLSSLFILIIIACVFMTLTPIAKAQVAPDMVEIAQQTPIPEQNEPNLYDSDEFGQPGINADTDTQYNEDGLDTDRDTIYDNDDVGAEIEPELMTQQQRSQSVLLWILVALGFATVAVLITISIIRNRNRREER